MYKDKQRSQKRALFVLVNVFIPFTYSKKSTNKKFRFNASWIKNKLTYLCSRHGYGALHLFDI